MDKHTLLVIAWAIGLFAIPYAVRLSVKNVHIGDTRDTAHIRSLTEAGMWIFFVWLVIGAIFLYVLLH